MTYAIPVSTNVSAKVVFEAKGRYETNLKNGIRAVRNVMYRSNKSFETP